MKLGIIAYEDDIIGFGLAGVEFCKEVPRNVSIDILQKQILALANDHIEAIIVPEELFELASSLTQVLLVPLLDPKKEVSFTRIEQLTKELLGITL